MTDTTNSRTLGFEDFTVNPVQDTPVSGIPNQRPEPRPATGEGTLRLTLADTESLRNRLRRHARVFTRYAPLLLLCILLGREMFPSSSPTTNARHTTRASVRTTRGTRYRPSTAGRPKLRDRDRPSIGTRSAEYLGQPAPSLPDAGMPAHGTPAPGDPAATGTPDRAAPTQTRETQVPEFGFEQ
jgi:hypothetical protein